MDCQTIRSFYRNTGAAAEGHPAGFIDVLNIETRFESELARVLPGRVVFVTGSAGDGKTHLVTRVESHAREHGVEIVKDANTVPACELARIIDEAVEQGSGLLVAINYGILREIADRSEVRDRDWAVHVRNRLYHPLDYGAARPENRSVLVVPLSHRNALDPEIVEQAIDKIAGDFTGCEACGSAGVAAWNARMLQRPEVKRTLLDLIEVIRWRGRHATMRELLGLISFLIMGGTRECGAQGRQAIPRYFENLFSGGIGGLFSDLRECDPVLRAHPLIDLHLWSRFRPDEWLDGEDERRCRQSDGRKPQQRQQRLREFDRIKRRALFEHARSGDLRPDMPSESKRMLDRLRGGADHAEALREVVEQLNAYFDPSIEQGRCGRRGRRLYLYSAFEYGDGQAGALVMMENVETKRLEVIVPRLPRELHVFFPDYVPDHVLLKHRDIDIRASVRIDAAVVELLTGGQRYRESGHMRVRHLNERLFRFYQRLIGLCDHDDEEREIRVVPLRDNMAPVEIAVDLQKGVYI